jgi:hypothetical protein
VRRYRDLKIHTPKKKSPVPGYQKRIKEASTKTQLASLRCSIENNLNVSNEELAQLITEIEQRKQDTKKN